MKFKERLLKRIFFLKFVLCCRHEHAFPNYKEERILKFLQLYFLSVNFCLTDGEIYFPLLTDLNTQVHFIKENDHYMQSQLQLLESADSRNAMDIFSTDQAQLILI